MPGEVQKELMASRPALQQLRDSLKASALSKPFTHQIRQPSSPATFIQGAWHFQFCRCEIRCSNSLYFAVCVFCACTTIQCNLDQYLACYCGGQDNSNPLVIATVIQIEVRWLSGEAQLTQLQQGPPPFCVEAPMHAGVVRTVPDLSFMGPAAAYDIRLQAALLTQPPAAVAGGLHGGPPAIWTPRIPPQPPPGPRFLAPPGLLMPRPQPPYGFMQQPAPPRQGPERQTQRPMARPAERAMPISRPGIFIRGPPQLQQRPSRPHMHEPQLMAPPKRGACGHGLLGDQAKRRKLGEQHAPAKAKRQGKQMQQADAKSNKGAAIALRTKLDDHRGAQECPPVSTALDGSPVPDQADPSTMDMPVDEHDAQRSRSADVAVENLNHKPEPMQPPGSAGAIHREVDGVDATRHHLKEQSEVLECNIADPAPPEVFMKERRKDQHGQHDSLDSALAADTLAAEPMEVAASDDVTAGQNSMDTTATQGASATEPQPTGVPEEPVCAAARLDNSRQLLHSSIAGTAALAAMRAAPQAQLLLNSRAAAGCLEAAQEIPSMGGSEAAQEGASLGKIAAHMSTGGPGVEQPRHSDEAMEDVHSIIKNAIAKAFGTVPPKRKADEIEEQLMEEKSCPVEKKRLVTDSITAFFKGTKGPQPSQLTL